MKSRYYLLLTTFVSISNVYAAPSVAPPILDTSIYRNAATATKPKNTVPPPPTYTDITADVIKRMDKLQSEVGQLKNELDEQNQLINNQTQQINNLKQANTELNNKLSTLNANKNLVPATPPIVNPVNPNPVVNPANPVNPPVTTLPASAGGEKDLYTNAFENLKAKNYDQAIGGFQALINKYPQGEYAGSSQYWIGAALFEKGNTDGALKAFDRVVHGYPKSKKVPDALFRLGDIQLGLGNKSKAKEYFDYLVLVYPDSTAAKSAASKKAQAGL